MDEDSNQNISVSDDVLNIENYFTNDQDVVNYFENAQNERKPLDKILENILKLGVIAVKSAQVGNQVDYVEKKFMAIQTRLEKQIDDQFGDHGDSNKRFMTEMFHQLGMDLGINSATEIEHQKGTQKGVEFEEYCEEIISDIAKHHNDRLEATGNITGMVEGSKKGDYIYTIGDSGKKIVLEMKDYNNPQSTPKLERYLNEAIENRGADYAIVISKRKSGFSKDVGIFQEYGNKLFVALTTEESDDVELQNELLVIALRWARLRLKQKSGTVDSSLIIEKIENIQRTMKKFSNIKTKCTSIKGTADEISEDLEELRDIIKADLLEVSKSLQ
jgi:hypothetical protein